MALSSATQDILRHMQTLLGEITLADDIFKKMIIENPLLVQAVEIAAVLTFKDA